VVLLSRRPSFTGYRNIVVLDQRITVYRNLGETGSNDCLKRIDVIVVVVTVKSVILHINYPRLSYRVTTPNREFSFPMKEAKRVDQLTRMSHCEKPSNKPIGRRRST
jgi:hypothetical protein